MIIVTRLNVTDAEVDQIRERIETLGMRTHLSRGEQRTVIGCIGDESLLHEAALLSLPGVESVHPVLKPYKLASREFTAGPSVIRVGEGVEVGGRALAVIAWEGAPRGPDDQTGAFRDQARARGEVEHRVAAEAFEQRVGQDVVVFRRQLHLHPEGPEALGELHVAHLLSRRRVVAGIAQHLGRVEIGLEIDRLQAQVAANRPRLIVERRFGQVSAAGEDADVPRDAEVVAAAAAAVYVAVRPAVDPAAACATGWPPRSSFSGRARSPNSRPWRSLRPGNSRSWS